MVNLPFVWQVQEGINRGCQAKRGKNITEAFHAFFVVTSRFRLSGSFRFVPMERYPFKGNADFGFPRFGDLPHLEPS